MAPRGRRSGDDARRRHAPGGRPGGRARRPGGRGAGGLRRRRGGGPGGRPALAGPGDDPGAHPGRPHRPHRVVPERDAPPLPAAAPQHHGGVGRGRRDDRDREADHLRGQRDAPGRGLAGGGQRRRAGGHAAGPVRPPRPPAQGRQAGQGPLLAGPAGGDVHAGPALRAPDARPLRPRDRLRQPGAGPAGGAAAAPRDRRLDAGAVRRGGPQDDPPGRGGQRLLAGHLRQRGGHRLHPGLRGRPPLGGRPAVPPRPPRDRRRAGVDVGGAAPLPGGGEPQGAGRLAGQLRAGQDGDGRLRPGPHRRLEGAPQGAHEGRSGAPR